jgi:hypothetical protein
MQTKVFIPSPSYESKMYVHKILTESPPTFACVLPECVPQSSNYYAIHYRDRARVGSDSNELISLGSAAKAA